MHKGTKIVAGLVAAPLLLGSLTACNKDAAKDTAAKAGSNASGDARTRLQNAMDKTSDTKKLQMSLKLGIDDETIDILGQDSKSKMTDNQKKLLTGSQLVVVQESTGANLKDEKDESKKNSSIAWKSDSNLVDLVVMGGKTMYAKADLAKIGQQTGGFDYAKIKSQMSAGAPGWMKDFIDGKYIGLDKTTLESIAKASGQPMPGSGAQSMTPEQQKQLQDALKANSDKNATFTGEGDNIKATVKLKPFVNQFVADAKRIVPQTFTPQVAGQVTKSLDGLKDDAVVNADFVLEDDKVKSATVDIVQIMEAQKSMSASDKKQLDQLKAKGKKFPVVMEYSEPDGGVKAPEGARMVTKQDIDQLMGGMRRTTPTS